MKPMRYNKFTNKFHLKNKNGNPGVGGYARYIPMMRFKWGANINGVHSGEGDPLFYGVALDPSKSMQYLYQVLMGDMW